MSNVLVLDLFLVFSCSPESYCYCCFSLRCSLDDYASPRVERGGREYQKLKALPSVQHGTPVAPNKHKAYRPKQRTDLNLSVSLKQVVTRLKTCSNRSCERW